MRTDSAPRALGLVLLLLLGVTSVTSAEEVELTGLLGAKLASMKERALKMNRELRGDSGPVKTALDAEWEKVSGRKLSGSGGPPKQTPDCFDMESRCSAMARSGSCSDPPTRDWMTKNCRLSCGVCGSMVNAAPVESKGVPPSVASQLKDAFAGKPKRGTPTPTPTPMPIRSPTRQPGDASFKNSRSFTLPETRKVKAPDDFGGFGKLSISQYLGALKKVSSVSNFMPVMTELGVETVADLAYLNPQHIGAALKLREPKAAAALGAEITHVAAIVTEAQAGLRKVLIPFKQKLFDAGTL